MMPPRGAGATSSASTTRDLAGAGGFDDGHRVGLVLREATGSLRSIRATASLVEVSLSVTLVGRRHQCSSVEAAKVFSQRCGEVISPSCSR